MNPPATVSEEEKKSSQSCVSNVWQLTYDWNQSNDRIDVVMSADFVQNDNNKKTVITGDIAWTYSVETIDPDYALLFYTTMQPKQSIISRCNSLCIDDWSFTILWAKSDHNHFSGIIWIQIDPTMLSNYLI